MNLSVETRTPREGVCVVSLAGEVDVHTSPHVRRRLADLLAAGERQLLIDLSRVEFLDSTALGVFVGAHGRARELDGRVAIIAPGSRTRRILELAGVNRWLDVYQGEAEALEER